MLKIRRSRDRLIFNIGIPILVRLHLYIHVYIYIYFFFFFTSLYWADPLISTVGFPILVRCILLLKLGPGNMPIAVCTGVASLQHEPVNMVCKGPASIVYISVAWFTGNFLAKLSWSQVPNPHDGILLYHNCWLWNMLNAKSVLFLTSLMVVLQ